MNWFGMTLSHALAMAWMTFWALVLGFIISAALQVFVSRERMSRAFGKTTWKSMALATALGAVNAAVEAGEDALIPALAFMFASTNLVIELGAVLWILMGWRFVLAEVIGALILIGCMWLLTSWCMPSSLRDEARRRAESAGSDEDCCHGEHQPQHDVAGNGKLGQLAAAFMADWRMLWKEILIGFLIAGFLMAAVPAAWWQGLLLSQSNAVIRAIENTLVAPLIAMASFVCSVGNIPLASLFWAHGISFGGVLSFIYADLLVFPLIIIYAKYYGTRATIYIVAIFYLSMVLAGIIVDGLFTFFGLIPSDVRPPSVVEHAQITWNYTSWLDVIAVVAFSVLFLVNLRRAKSDSLATSHRH